MMYDDALIIKLKKQRYKYKYKHRLATGLTIYNIIAVFICKD